MSTQYLKTHVLLAATPLWFVIDLRENDAKLPSLGHLGHLTDDR